MGSPAILKAALEKAKANGWAYKHELDRLHIEYLLTYNGGVYLPIIFSHGFAKALWGEADEWGSTECTCGGKIHPLMDMHDPSCARVTCKRGYKFHLQQMVVADNRLEYLGTNI